MPLLIGPFAGVVLLSVLVAPALGSSEGSEATREGVVAPEVVAGEPTPENAVEPAPSVEPTVASMRTTVAFLAVHVLWGAGSGAWLWRRRRDLLGPASTAPDTPVPRLGWVLLAGAIFVWFGMVTGAGSAQLLMRIGPDDYETLRGMTLVNCGGYVGGLLALGFMGVMLGPLVRVLGRRPRPSDALRGLGAYGIAHPIVWLTGWVSIWVAQALAGSRRIDPLAHETLRAMAEAPKGLWWTLGVVIAVVAAPVLEELVYRGLLQNGLVRLTRSPRAAIAGAALAFALMHYSNVAPHALPTLFVLGVAFGVAYQRTRSLLVSIAMHAIFNAVNLALVSLPL